MTRRLLFLAMLMALPSVARAQIISTQVVNALSTGSGCTAVAHSCASFSVASNPTVTMQVNLTSGASLTLTFEGTSDGINWITIAPVDLSLGTVATTATATGQFAFANTGLLQIRARCTTYSSGTATITGTRGQLHAGLGGGGSGGGGGVSSVGASFTGGLVSVSGSPVTTSGTLAFTVAGTSGGIPYFGSGSTWASSGALTANLPVIGGGAGAAPSVGSRSGNTTKFVTTTGSLTTNNCLKVDASGNAVDAGTTCGGSGTTPQIQAAYVSKTANYTAVIATDGIIECKTNAFAITLPTAVGVTGQAIVVLNQQTANACTINTTSGQTVNGAASGTVTVTNTAVTFASDGANWVIPGASGLPLAAITSGGVLYGSGSATVAFSAALTAHGVVVGGGAGTAPTSTSAGTTGYTLQSNGASADPTFAQQFNRTILVVGNCQGGSTASLSANTQASGAATAGCTGTTITEGTASFANATTNELQYHFTIPDNWDGAAMTMSGFWRSSATSNSVIWQVKGVCGTDGAVLPTAYSSTADTVTDTAKGTTLQRNAFLITLSVAANHSLATCSAGNEFYFTFFRDNSDSLGAAAELMDSLTIKGGKNGG